MDYQLYSSPRDTTWPKGEQLPPCYLALCEIIALCCRPVVLFCALTNCPHLANFISSCSADTDRRVAADSGRWVTLDYTSPGGRCGVFRRPTAQCGVLRRPTVQWGVFRRPTVKWGVFRRPTVQCSVFRRPTVQCGGIFVSCFELCDRWHWKESDSLLLHTLYGLLMSCSTECNVIQSGHDLF
jgi:hypothetical protein